MAFLFSVRAEQSSDKCTDILKDNFDTSFLCFRSGSEEYQKLLDAISEIGFSDADLLGEKRYFSDFDDEQDGLFFFSVKSKSSLKLSVAADGVVDINFLRKNSCNLEIFVSLFHKKNDIFYSKISNCDFGGELLCVNSWAKSVIENEFPNQVFHEIKESGTGEKFYWLDSDVSVTMKSLFVEGGYSAVGDSCYIKMCNDHQWYFSKSDLIERKDCYWIGDSFLMASARLRQFFQQARPRIKGFSVIRLNKNRLPNVMIPIWDEAGEAIELAGLQRRVELVRSKIGADWAVEPFMPSKLERKRMLKEDDEAK